MNHLPALLLALGLAAQPGPPASGPGSRSYPSGRSVQVTDMGGRAGGFVLYEPSPPPASAPVVVYFHGFQPLDSRGFADDLLRHMALKGSIVVYVEQGTTDTPAYPAHARAAIAAAMKTVGTKGHVKPDRGLAYVGFSLGGIVALRLAAAESPPAGRRPDVVVLHDPAGEASPDPGTPTLAGLSPAFLPATTKLLVLQAEESAGDANSAAPAAWALTRKLTTRNWLLIPSDSHGFPPMRSDHVASGSGRGPLRLLSPLDAVDWWGYRRPTDGALSEAFGRGDLGRYQPFFAACGGITGPDSVRHMGKWSDGQAVQPMKNAADLTTGCP